MITKSPSEGLPRVNEPADLASPGHWPRRDRYPWVMDPAETASPGSLTQWRPPPQGQCPRGVDYNLKYLGEFKFEYMTPQSATSFLWRLLLKG